MATVIGPEALVWGIQLPVQSQSRIFVQDWELTAGPSAIAEVARAADRAGAYYVGVCDHVAVPRPLDETMGTVWYDTVATLGWLAAQTERVHLLSHVYVVPYRAPLVTAKAFLTLDTLSGGRAILGVGAGHVAGEFELVGVDFESRGRILDAALPEIRDAFANAYVHDAAVAPRVAGSAGPPIWVGGSSVPAMRRAARLGDGWLPQGPPKMGMRAAIELIRAERAAFLGDDAPPMQLGSYAGPIHVGEPTWDLPAHTSSGPPGAIAERLGKLARLGVSHLQPTFPSRSAAELAEQLERFGTEVWPLVEGAVGPSGPA